MSLRSFPIAKQKLKRFILNEKEVGSGGPEILNTDESANISLSNLERLFKYSLFWQKLTDGAFQENAFILRFIQQDKRC